MQNTTKNQCGDCYFFEIEDSKKDFGFCHKFPPSANQLGNWPPVFTSDWCGEFSASIESVRALKQAINDEIARRI